MLESALFFYQEDSRNRTHAVRLDKCLNLLSNLTSPYIMFQKTPLSTFGHQIVGDQEWKLVDLSGSFAILDDGGWFGPRWK